MYAATWDHLPAFLEFKSDRFGKECEVEWSNAYGPIEIDGLTVLQFVLPFEMDASKKLYFRGSQLTSVDSRTFIIGGIPFEKFEVTGVMGKDVVDTSEYIPNYILMYDVDDFINCYGNSYHTGNKYLSMNDVDLATSPTSSLYTFKGIFDGQNYRLSNKAGIYSACSPQRPL